MDARRAAADSTRDRVTKAKRELELANNRLAYHPPADTDGLVTAVPVEAGQVVSPSDVAGVARAGHREAVVSIPEHRLELASGTAESSWSAGRPATRTLRAVPGRRPDDPHLPGPVHDPAIRTLVEQMSGGGQPARRSHHHIAICLVHGVDDDADCVKQTL